MGACAARVPQQVQHRARHRGAGVLRTQGVRRPSALSEGEVGLVYFSRARKALPRPYIPVAANPLARRSRVPGSGTSTVPTVKSEAPVARWTPEISTSYVRENAVALKGRDSHLAAAAPQAVPENGQVGQTPVFPRNLTSPLWGQRAHDEGPMP